MFKKNLMFSEWFILYPSEIRYISPLLNLKHNSQPQTGMRPASYTRDGHVLKLI